MGICNSTTKKEEKILENLNFNYSFSLDEEKIKEHNSKYFAKLNINLIHSIKGKNFKDLILKKFYLNQNGKIIGEIPNKKSKGIIYFDGSLDSQGNFKMESIEENEEIKSETTYQGSLKIKKDSVTFLIEGNASRKILSGNSGNEIFNFILNFGENQCILEYTFEEKIHTIKPFLDLNDNEFFISSITGIAYEEHKGLSMFIGIEDNKREITLTQIYIDESRQNEHKIYYVGIIDRIKSTIEGEIKGGRLDGSKFKISMIK